MTIGVESACSRCHYRKVVKLVSFYKKYRVELPMSWAVQLKETISSYQEIHKSVLTKLTENKQFKETETSYSWKSFSCTYYDYPVIGCEFGAWILYSRQINGVSQLFGKVQVIHLSRTVSD